MIVENSIPVIFAPDPYKLSAYTLVHLSVLVPKLYVLLPPGEMFPNVTELFVSDPDVVT